MILNFHVIIRLNRLLDTKNYNLFLINIFLASSSDTVVSEGRSDQGTCSFGNLSVGIGGELNQAEGKGTCKCVVPPQVECFNDGS